MQSSHPLEQLDGSHIGAGVLRLARLATTAKSGWRDFELVFCSKGARYSPPIVRGVYSAGGRWVTPWIELIDYRPKVRHGRALVDLAVGGADRRLFRLLAALIPAGGHLMLGCESPAHRYTYLALCQGVPPVATPLGQVLLEAGFPRVKFFDLPEGGKEGQKKLWAERPLDRRMAEDWARATAEQLHAFLREPKRPGGSDDRTRAKAALEYLERGAFSRAP